LEEGGATTIRPVPLNLVQGTTAELKVGDTARAWTSTLAINGTPVNLTGATVTLRRRQTNPLVAGEETETMTMDVVSSAAGTVSYQPLEEDVDTAADFDIEFYILYADLSDLTLPENGFIKMKIYPALP
jgi:hypothetical protein